jgi:hypothetical protein
MTLSGTAQSLSTQAPLLGIVEQLSWLISLFASIIITRLGTAGSSYPVLSLNQ